MGHHSVLRLGDASSRHSPVPVGDQLEPGHLLVSLQPCRHQFPSHRLTRSWAHPCDYSEIGINRSSHDPCFSKAQPLSRNSDQDFEVQSGLGESLSPSLHILTAKREYAVDTRRFPPLIIPPARKHAQNLVQAVGSTQDRPSASHPQSSQLSHGSRHRSPLAKVYGPTRLLPL